MNDYNEHTVGHNIQRRNDIQNELLWLQDILGAPLCHTSNVAGLECAIWNEQRINIRGFRAENFDTATFGLWYLTYEFSRDPKFIIHFKEEKHKALYQLTFE